MIAEVLLFVFTHPFVFTRLIALSIAFFYITHRRYTVLVYNSRYVNHTTIIVVYKMENEHTVRKKQSYFVSGQRASNSLMTLTIAERGKL